VKLEIDGEAKEGREVHLSIDVSNQFDCEGVWLRGNLHCHVGQMGGGDACCQFYRALGHQFLASTDYATVTSMPGSTGDFIAIPGAEMFGVGNAHIICVGLARDVAQPAGSTDDIARVVHETEAMGGLAILAHPYWSDFDWCELLQVARTGVVGFELSNRLCWRINGKERSEELWQLLLREGIRLAAVGVDDSTSLAPEVAGGTWTGVLSAERTAKGVLDAIRSHRCYASEGPVIHAIRFEPRGAIAVESSVCVACHFQSRDLGVRTIFEAQGAERFEVDLRREGYRLRDWLVVCLEDRNGRRAWSSSIPVRVEVHDLRAQ